MVSALTESTAAPRLSTAWQVATQRRQTAWLAVLVVGAAGLMLTLALLLEITSVVVVLIWIVVGAIAWRPRVGLYSAFGLVLLFEEGGADALMTPGAYLIGGLSATLGLNEAIASPLELLLVLTFSAWLLQGIASQRLKFRGGSLAWPFALFFLALLFGLVRGQLAGGDLNVALWESRFLFYMVFCYILAANTIRTTRHVAILLGIAFLAMGIFAVEGAYRRIALVDTGVLAVPKEIAYAHDSAVFLGVLILLIVAQQVFGAPRWQRLLGPVLLIVASYTLLATERRAGYIALMVAFLAFGAVFLAIKRKAFLLVTLPVLVCGVIYLPLFWTNTSLLGQPARAIRSLYEPDPRDAKSNRYRDLERINVRSTIRSDPLLGVGFGREYNFVVKMPDLSWWPFWHFEPHNTILWIWLKTGVVGFILFWVLMVSAVARAAYLAKAMITPQARTFALLAIAGFMGFLVFSYVDLGLVSARVTVFLGTLMGTIAVLDRIVPDQSSDLEV